MKKVAVINGPNLNMTGLREQGIYGQLTLSDINKKIEDKAKTLGIECEFLQSNCEGEIIDKIHSLRGKADGIILNAGAYTHYSYAIRDAITAAEVDTVEVHMSNVHKREEFRHTSVISAVCHGVIAGFGYKSYLMALDVFGDE